MLALVEEKTWSNEREEEGAAKRNVIARRGVFEGSVSHLAGVISRYFLSLSFLLFFVSFIRNIPPVGERYPP